MNEIQVLDSATVNRIAAGEVVERPCSVIKELLENAIDAEATSVTVEIKEGGTTFMRITDNGHGIEKDQVRKAFLRHATSKIRSAQDLLHISSLGFRGEALSSIAAVSQVELITKTRDALTGIRMILEGENEIGFEEVGAPDGTTFLVRNLFFNTPARKKFLKSPTTEGGAVTDLMEHMALSRPDIAMKFIVNGQMKFFTSGNGDVKEVIYRIYGREFIKNLVEIHARSEMLCLDGYLGTPSVVRSNRNFEIYFLNGRYIKSTVVAKAVEEGYRQYLMQHKFPLCFLNITVEDLSLVDVNVHPAKMEVRFQREPEVFEMISSSIRKKLFETEMIPAVSFAGAEAERRMSRSEIAEAEQKQVPSGIIKTEQKQVSSGSVKEEQKQNLSEPAGREQRPGHIGAAESKSAVNTERTANPERTADLEREANPATERKQTEPEGPEAEKKQTIPEPFEFHRREDFRVREEVRFRAQAEEIREFQQENLFSDKILVPEKKQAFRLIGQVFETYWMIEAEQKLLIVDQHAAHEKVKYERFMKQYHEKSVASQNLLPAIVLTLSGQEERTYLEYASVFADLGFEVEPFGGREYTLRAVPLDLYGCQEKELFLQVLDELSELGLKGDLRVITDKIASMACKAAVKGNSLLSETEAYELIDELLQLENPYNCPHGRPTIVSVSKYEMEKKFKR